MMASSTATTTSSLLLPPVLLLLLLLTLVSSLLLLLFSLVRKISSGRTGAQRLPPGSEGFPLVGETLRLISAYKTETPDSFIDERVRKHRNRIFRSHVFGERTVFSADPEVNRLVLQSEGKLFESSYPTSITTLLGRHSLLLTRAAYHRRMHSLTLSSFSNPAVLRDLLLPDIHRVVHRNLRSWGLDDRVFSLLDQAKKITFELAVRQLMSCEPGEWTEGLRREYLLLINGFFCVPLPLPFTTYGRALKARAKVAHQIRMVVRNRIAEHAAAGNVQKTMGCMDKNKNHRDVLDRLLADGVREEEEVVDFLLALLVAAYETTPTAMTLAIKFLTETPAALARLREEHDRVRERKQPRERGSGDGSEDEDYNAFDWVDYKTAMPFTHSVINETLRISNVISGVFRRATTDVHIKGGYVIPKGCKVFASFRAVHMDQEHFEDARTFNPWRWHRQAEEVDRRGDETETQEEEAKRRGKSSATHATTAAATFCVFGGGARLCPGHELARVELCAFLHHLLTAFSWDAAEEDKLVFFPTTRTLKGYPIRVRPRCPAPTEI